MDEKQARWTCGKCNEPLTLKKTRFSYLGHNFTHDVLRCNACGGVFIPKELAEGRMAEVEAQMEDK